MHHYYNKPGTAQVGAISKAQKSKMTSKCRNNGKLVTFYERKKLKKRLTMPKKTESEDLLGFFNIHFVAKLQKK